MLGKTDPPRDHLTTAQVDELLTGQSVTRGFGCELWNGTGWEDISADCKGFTVSRDNNAEVHGSIRIDLTREFPWGRARIRPFRTLSKRLFVADPGGALSVTTTSAKFFRGVFILTTPATNRGRTPIVYSVSGQDLLQLLTRQVGETYVVTAGTTYMQALRDLLAAAGIDAAVLLDGTRQDTVLPETRVWGLTTGPRWLDVANDLLAEIAYCDLWCDESGNFRSQPVVEVATRPVEHRFDTSDQFTDLIAADRSEEYDAWSAPNTWRFVRTRLAYQPFEGDGIYEVINQSDGDSSVDSVGVVSVTHYLEVADQAALVAEGDRIVAADRRAERQFTLRVDPYPIAWHRDVVELLDADRLSKVQVASWDEPTTGRGTWVLGGGPGGDSPARVEQQATATVTSGTADAGGLRVVLDGAEVDSPAVALQVEDTATGQKVDPTYSIGQRVSTTVRNPVLPLVQGIETTGI